MGLRLLVRLGPQTAIKLFKALGELSHAGQATESSQDSVGRRRFFQLSAGISIAASIVLTGKAPALADDPGKARAWVMANLDRLPQDYVAFSQHSAPYRRAIYAKLDPSVRSRLWIDHFAQYRRTHPNLSSRQQRILTDLEAYVRIESNLLRRSPDEDRGDERLKFEVIDAFGKDEARNLVANLGPAEPVRTGPTDNNLVTAVDCECSPESDWCGGSWKCYWYRDCRNLWDACGWLHSYDCTGMCMCTCVVGDDSPSA
ncbi:MULTISPECIES: bacteriocin fulvocin C-related protein [Streptosporangium]|uniref:Bacteriocin fulvocin C-related protein n=1 Tax=Streptosporangium brasiliense TaxID=47480 RepID=A0ABT9R9V1_9ACTN|nr:bacteriocin fulvocin C-related protein [Streptosporangium brasiliense]MDP9866026.1 hypothetical protein [Streptosporangium brasiliense]